MAHMGARTGDGAATAVPGGRCCASEGTTSWYGVSVMGAHPPPLRPVPATAFCASTTSGGATTKVEDHDSFTVKRESGWADAPGPLPCCREGRSEEWGVRTGIVHGTRLRRVEEGGETHLWGHRPASLRRRQLGDGHSGGRGHGSIPPPRQRFQRCVGPCATVQQCVRARRRWEGVTAARTNVARQARGCYSAVAPVQAALEAVARRRLNTGAAVAPVAGA